MKRTDAREIIDRNRERGQAYIAKAGTTPLARLLEKADAELLQRLARAQGLRGTGDKGFTEIQAEQVLEQVRDVTSGVVQGMQGILVGGAQGAATGATDALVDYMIAADAQFRGIGMNALPIDRALLLERAAAGAKSSILHRIEASDVGEDEGPLQRARKGVLDRYGEATIARFEERLQVGLVTRKSWIDMRNDLTEQSEFLQGAPVYWAERIVRTELMGAQNRAAGDAISDLDESLGGDEMLKVLCATFDARTEWDSYAVHGQVRRPPEPFEYFTYRAERVLYAMPPNRPNDRESVVPHHRAWKLPEYLRPRPDGEYKVHFARRYKKRAPPPRPKMTTVDDLA